MTPIQPVEVPREAWFAQLNAFTLQHEGWLVSLDAMGPDVGAQPQIDNLPLLGVSADRGHDDVTVAISVARSAGDHFTHVIHGVQRLYVRHPNNGATAALLVESAQGLRTVLRVRAAPDRQH